MSKIIVLMGAPGAGKGTQARLLQERLGLPQISTGDMFRALKEARTPLAEEVRAIMEAGQLVPDDLTIRVVRERTGRDDCKHGYILDGFPRTPAQAAMLEKLAVEQGKKIQAILVDVPLELLEKRMTGRRTCPVCGEIYNVYFKPPKVDEVCDLHPDTPLTHRADDNPETVQARLRTFEEQTRPLLEFYRKANLLHRVDGTRAPEEIYGEIERIVTGDK
jgi:adenylate kinase